MQSETFMVLSKCFAPLSADSWEEIVSCEWPSFLEGLAADLPHDDASQHLLDTLATPPCYEDKHTFAARHFTGGLPASAMPIESLYTRKMPDDLPEYYQEPALYMKDLIASLGCEIPDGFETYPDHITLELEVLALLLESDMDSARDFAFTRFNWLAEFGGKIKAFGAESSFYAAAVDATIVLIDALREEK